MKEAINLVKVPSFWKAAEDVKIGICDCGVARHDDIDHSNISSKSFGKKKGIVELNNPEYGHGTHVAGIIQTISPEARLFSAECLAGKSGGYKNLEDAISWCAENRVDVLNLSIAYSKDDSRIKGLLKEMSQDGCIICASAAKDPLIYPAKYGYTISCSSFMYYNDDADVYLPARIESAVLNNQRKTMAGNSMACAYMSAICAMAKGFDPEIKRDQVLSNLVPLTRVPRKVSYVLAPKLSSSS